MTERCPRCGTAEDATAVLSVPIPPGDLAALRRHLEIVRLELGIATEGEALAESARRLALQLNQQA